LTTEREKKSAPDRLRAHEKQRRQNEEHDHDGIGVAMKTADHERDRTEHEQQQRPSRQRKLFAAANLSVGGSILFSKSEQRQDDDEIGHDAGQPQQKWKCDSVVAKERLMIELINPAQIISGQRRMIERDAV